VQNAADYVFACRIPACRTPTGALTLLLIPCDREPGSRRWTCQPATLTTSVALSASSRGFLRMFSLTSRIPTGKSSSFVPDSCSCFVTRKSFRQGLWILQGESTQPMRGRGVNPKDCPICTGTGYVAKPVDMNEKSDGIAFIRVKCPACGGTGQTRPLPPSATG